MGNEREAVHEEHDAGAASRRTFLARTGAAAGGLLLVGAGPAAAAAPAVHTGPRRKTLEEVIHEGAQQQPYPAVVRSDVTTFTNGSAALAALKSGVSVMKGRAASDTTSWTFQAGIHDTWCDNPPVPNGYVHYSWRFLVWHRAYLYFMERILQQAAGPTTSPLALPYWNWTVDLKLPYQYWGTGNPLYDPNRVMTQSSSLDPNQTAISGLLALTTFQAFGGTASAAGSVETGPHNYVHRMVGGDMGAFSTAALDPIFWAHHCNVDRVWWLWLNEGGGRENPVDPAWLTQTYPFYDTAGNQLTIDFKTAASLPVSYNPPPAVVSLSSAARVNGPQTVRGRLDRATLQAIATRTPAPTPPPVLHVSGVMVPDQAVTVNVFVNRPDATEGTSTSDRAFAGSFTLIPSGHQHDVEVRVPMHHAVPQLLQAMAASPTTEQGISITLVPVGARTVTYGALELEV